MSPILLTNPTTLSPATKVWLSGHAAKYSSVVAFGLVFVNHQRDENDSDNENFHNFSLKSAPDSACLSRQAVRRRRKYRARADGARMRKRLYFLIIPESVRFVPGATVYIRAVQRSCARRSLPN